MTFMNFKMFLSKSLDNSEGVMKVKRLLLCVKHLRQTENRLSPYICVPRTVLRLQSQDEFNFFFYNHGVTNLEACS